ncbi:MAG: amino acid kinase family protein [Gemmatimonadales bacterium]
MTQPLVLKFGGDALATPERIAAAARRVVRRRADAPVVVVASARRGVTDHLLSLVEQVRDASGRVGAGTTSPAADRVVTSGEIVAASLLALALGELGVPAIALEAREAGLRTDPRAAGGALLSVQPARVRRWLDRGIVPVVTGFQGWYRGRVAALGRGGSDVTAVALAGALGAVGCELVKDPGALHTADPKLIPEARPIPRVDHRFVTDLAHAGARVIHRDAADRAEREGVPLRFTSLHVDGEPATAVGPGAAGGAAAVVLAPGGPAAAGPLDVGSIASITAVLYPRDGARAQALLHGASAAGIDVLRTMRGDHGPSFLVRSADGVALLRHIHAVLLASIDSPGATGYAAYA